MKILIADDEGRLRARQRSAGSPGAVAGQADVLHRPTSIGRLRDYGRAATDGRKAEPLTSGGRKFSKLARAPGETANVWKASNTSRNTCRTWCTK